MEDDLKWRDCLAVVDVRGLQVRKDRSFITYEERGGR